MSPIKTLEKGIRTSDWSLVCKAYETLSGESIPVPAAGDDKWSRAIAEIMGVLINHGAIGFDVPSVQVEPAIEEAPFEVPVIKEKIVKVPKAPKKPKRTKPSAYDDPNAEEVPVQSVGVVGERREPFRSGPVNAKANKPSLPAAGEIDKEYREKCLADPTANRKPDSPRDAYKPKEMKCSQCGCTFDYNKDYPVGKFGDGKEYKCGKCQTLRR
jgi:hypothetical protein